ncbi:MAG: lysophospholipid acyltransferase family protein [Pirellulales bacterium]
MAYKLRDPRLIRVASWLAAGTLRPWLASLRTDVYAGEYAPQPADPRERRFIYVLWHESLLAALLFRHVTAHVLISQHADGEVIAQVCDRLGVGVVRGSSKQGGAKALMQMYRLSETSHLVITPDGPRGPRRTLQPGVIQLAAHVGLPIFPIGIGFCGAWRANSWDKFAVPLPFSKIVFRGGPPLVIPPKTTGEDLEFQRRRVEQALLDITAVAEKIAAGGKADAAHAADAHAAPTLTSTPAPTPTPAARAAARPVASRIVSEHPVT